MSLVRSIDRTDLGSANVSLAPGIETVVLVSPSLQTPKDISIVVMLGSVHAVVASGTTSIQVAFRQGTTITGAVIGDPSVITPVSGSGYATQVLMVSAPANFTDYQQWCLTAKATGAATNCTVTGSVVLAMSF